MNHLSHRGVECGGEGLHIHFHIGNALQDQTPGIFPPDGRVPPGIPPRGGAQDKWQMGSPPELNQGPVKPFNPSADEEWRKGSFEPNDMMQEPPNRLPVPHDLSEGSSSEHHWQASHREGTTMNEEEYNGEEDTGWDYSETGFDSHGPPEEDEPPYEGDRGVGEVQSQEYRHREFSRRTPTPKLASDSDPPTALQ